MFRVSTGWAYRLISTGSGDLVLGPDCQMMDKDPAESVFRFISLRRLERAESVHSSQAQGLQVNVLQTKLKQPTGSSTGRHTQEILNLTTFGDQKDRLSGAPQIAEPDAFDTDVEDADETSIFDAPSKSPTKDLKPSKELQHFNSTNVSFRVEQGRSVPKFPDVLEVSQGMTNQRVGADDDRRLEPPYDLSQSNTCLWPQSSGFIFQDQVPTVELTTSLSRLSATPAKYGSTTARKLAESVQSPKLAKPRNTSRFRSHQIPCSQHVIANNSVKQKVDLSNSMDGDSNSNIYGTLQHVPSLNLLVKERMQEQDLLAHDVPRMTEQYVGKFARLSSLASPSTDEDTNNHHTTYGDTDLGSTEGESSQHEPAKLLTGQIRSRKRPKSLDYPIDVLAQMTYQDLKHESLNHEPIFKGQELPAKLVNGSASDKLNYVFSQRHYDEGGLQRRDFFKSLKIEEHEESGDLIVGRFVGILNRFKHVRQQKRNVCRGFEEEIERRQNIIKEKRDAIECDLKAMQMKGENFIPTNMYCKPLDGSEDSARN